MEIDFADILLEVLETGASDLHLTAGSPPMLRKRGQLRPIDAPVLGPQEVREIVYSILSNAQRQKLETDWQIDLAYSIPGKARFRVNAYFQRASIGAAFRLIPQEMPALDTLGLPSTLRSFTNKPRGFVLVTGPTGSGKSTTLAAMIDVINEERKRAHPHDRGPDRVPAPAQELHRQPARARCRRPELRDGAQGRAAPGPGRDPGRRDARPGHHLHGAHRGGDRPPGVRHSAHPGRRLDGGPDRGRVPTRAAAPGAGAAFGGAAGHRDPAAAAHGRRQGPLSWHPRCWCPRPRCAT